MTKDEFEQWYATGSGTTVEMLHAWGLYAEPCDCGDAICKGWQIVHGFPSRLHDSRTALATKLSTSGNRSFQC